MRLLPPVMLVTTFVLFRCARKKHSTLRPHELHVERELTWGATFAATRTRRRGAVGSRDRCVLANEIIPRARARVELHSRIAQVNGSLGMCGNRAFDSLRPARSRQTTVGDVSCDSVAMASQH